MNKFKLILSGLFLLTATCAYADTVYLKNGTAVKGKVVEEKRLYIKVIQDGEPYKIYIDEVDRIVKDDIEVAYDPLKFVGIPEEKVKLILTFVEVNGTRKNMQKNIDLLLEKTDPLKQEELKEFFNVSEIIESLVPIYDSYYNEEELKEAIAFYRSDTGQKVLESTPKIMSDAMKMMLKQIHSNPSM